MLANKDSDNCFETKGYAPNNSHPHKPKDLQPNEGKIGDRKHPPASTERASCSGDKMSFYYYPASITETPFICVNVLWVPH